MLDVKSKFGMKKVYEKAGLRVARGKIIKSFEDAEEFIGSVGYPIVAKPDTGVGAENTHKINNVSDLKSFSPNFSKDDELFLRHKLISNMGRFACSWEK